MISALTTLDAFLSVLARFDYSANRHGYLTSLLQEWALDPADLGVLRAPRSGRHAGTMLARCPQFELVAMSWAPGAATPVHDHGDAAAYLVVLRGELAVDDYIIVRRDAPGLARIAPTGSRALHRGQVDIRASSLDLRRLRAAKPAISLHLYAGPLQTLTVYDESDGSYRPGTPHAECGGQVPAALRPSDVPSAYGSVDAQA
jgi:predicted metal-dependent enzyme (double-stranded beta helix superfamily)